MPALSRTVTLPLTLAVMTGWGVLAGARAAGADPALAARIEALGEQALVDPGPAVAAMDALLATLETAREPVAALRLAELRCNAAPTARDGVEAARQRLAALPPLPVDAPSALRAQQLRLRVCERVRTAYGGSPEEIAGAERDLEAIEAQADAAGLPGVRALARMERGELLSSRRELARSQPLLLEACQQLRQDGPREDRWRCQGLLAGHYGRAGDVEQAIALSQELIDLALARGWHAEAATRLHNQALFHMRLEDWPRARSGFEASLALRPPSQVQGAAMARKFLGGVLNAQRQPERALEVLEQAVDGFRRSGLSPHVALASLEMAESRFQQGRLAEARALIDAHRGVVDAPQFAGERISVTLLDARVHAALGQLGPAQAAMEEVLRLKDASLRRQLDAQSARLRLQFDRERDEARVAALEALNQQGRALRDLQATVLVLALLLLAGTAAYAVHKVRQARRLHALALQDALTGLPNRRALNAHAASRPAGDGPMSVVMLDLDHFKRVNDGHGHAAGDAVLREIARRLPGVLRHHDRVGRWGGEEFLALLSDTAPAAATQVAQRLHEAVRAAPVPLPDGGTLPVTVSLGVATCREGERLEDLIARADAALYAAKAAGRDQVRIAD
jgi:diguanylate cyclase (GGDEF)-like protein